MSSAVGDSGGVDRSARSAAIARSLNGHQDRSAIPNQPPSEDLIQTLLQRRPSKIVYTDHSQCDHTYRVRSVIRDVPHYDGVWYMFTAYCYVMNKSITVKCPHDFFWKGEGIEKNAPDIDMVPLT